MIFNKTLFDELNKNQQMLMNYLERKSSNILKQSIISIAKANNVSPSFVTKTLKKMGFYGWKDYRAFVMAKMIVPKSSGNYMKYVEGNLFSSIRASIAYIDEMKVVHLAKKIAAQRGDIIFCGEGFSFYIAEDQARRYNKRGIKTFPINPLNKDYQSIATNDLVILISASGRTKSIENIAKELVAKGITYYLLTINPDITSNYKNVICGRMYDADSINEREFPRISRFILILICDWIYSKFENILMQDKTK